MSLKSCVLAMLIASASVPLCAATRAQVTIGAPVILVDSLDPDPGASATWTEGGERLEEFDVHLRPAPAAPDVGGNAEITADTATEIGGRTDGPDSYFFVLGDRYAPSFTFTASAHSRITVQAPYTLTSAIDEPFYRNHPARTSASFELMVVAFNNLAIDDEGHISYDLLAVERDFAELTTTLDPTLRGARSSQGVLTVSFDNLSDQPAVFAFRGQMVAYGVSAPLTPAPEPVNAMLMLAGLGMVGAFTLRRRRDA